MRACAVVTCAENSVTTYTLTLRDSRRRYVVVVDGRVTAPPSDTSVVVPLCEKHFPFFSTGLYYSVRPSPGERPDDKQDARVVSTGLREPQRPVDNP